ncbi:MAG: tetratricopeptide repeat protein [Elusimicrobiota bacterium]
MANTFLTWGAGARALGMGKAYVAVANDATAGFWNPGGLAQVDRAELNVLHAFLWEGTVYDYAGYVVPTLKNGTFGVNAITLLSIGGEGRDALNRVNNQTFIDSRLLAGGCYAREIGDWLSLGGAVNVLNSSLGQHSKLDMTIDAGALMKFFGGLTLGVNIKNMLVARLSGNSQDVLSPVIRAGVAGHFWDNRMIAACDVEYRENTVVYYLGVEAAVFNLFKLRIGQSQQEVSAGFGINVFNMMLDYALGLHSLGGSHRMSLTMKFGGSVKAELNKQNEKARLELDELFKKLYESGIQAYQEGKFDEAHSMLAQARSINPQDEDVKILTSRLQLVVALLPTSVGTGKVSELLRAGVTKYLEGDAEQAITKITYAYTLDPDNKTIERLLNRLQRETGVKIDTAPPGMGTLVDQKLLQAYIQFSKRDFAGTILLCQEVLSLESRNILAYKRMGTSYLLLGERDKAVKLWEKALEINPNDTALREYTDSVKKQIGQ